MSQRLPVVLRIHKAGNLVGVKQFTENQIVFGSQPEVQVPLEGGQVSVIHCAIEERENTWHLADLGSEAGTKQNGQVILDSELRSGDTIEVGEYKIEFYIGIPKPKAPPPSTTNTVDIESGPVIGGAVADSTPIPFDDQTPTPLLPQSAPAPVVDKVENESPAVPTRSHLIANTVTPPKKPAIDVIQTKLDTVAARPSRPAVKKETKKKSRKTFAPPSNYTSIKDFVKPTKGSVVEVLVAWKERIISTHSFGEQKIVTVGSLSTNDIAIPIMGGRLKSAPIVKVDQPCVVYLLPEANGEVIRGQTSISFLELGRTGRISRTGEQSAVALEQGEMLKMDVGDDISIVVRYVSAAPKPLLAPFFDLSNSEVTGVVLALALTAVLSLYMYLYTPTAPLVADAGLDEPLRTAVVIVAPTPPPPLPPVVPAPAPTPEPVKPTPAPVAKATPSPIKQVVAQKQEQAKSVVAKKDPGVAANPVPNKNKTGPRAQTSVKQGGAIKTTDSNASQMQSKSKDASKSGIFGALGGGGAQNTLAASTTGAGELAGLSAAATGKSGMNENRDGQGLGSKTLDTGRGGTGKALEGIAGGVATQGRGGGNSGYGTGGLGGRTGVKVVAGGEGEAFSGTIDREAIRRVIKANERAIRSCYERELNRTPDLIGKLVIAFDIGEQGVVVKTDVQRNELGNKAVADCVMARLKTWRFPEPPANQVVSVAYPFVFSN